MKNKIKPSILPGFMELTPMEQVVFDDIVRKFIKVYEDNGCLPIDTPLIEKEEILLAKTAGETEKQVYSIAREDKKQALRFDLTVPFARYVIQHMNDLTFPFKRYQLGKVYRGEKAQRGRYREFYQLDIDIVNTNQLDIQNDAFVISLAAQAFVSIGLENYTFQLSNRKILFGILEILRVEDKQQVMTIIDKYDKIGQEECFSQIDKLVGEERCTIITELLTIEGTNKELIEKLYAFQKSLEAIQRCRDNAQQEDSPIEEFLEGVKELEQVITTLSILGVEERFYKVNLKIIRGLDYYTGTIFETILKEYGQYGSICSGGRYDDLAQLYTSNKIPGVGISIGVTRLFYILKEIGFLDNYKTINTVDYLIIPLDDTLKTCTQVNQYLQQKGFKSEIYLNKGTLKKQLNYANKKAIPKVIIIGDKEVDMGYVILKDMITGEQITKKISDL